MCILFGLLIMLSASMGFVSAKNDWENDLRITAMIEFIFVAIAVLVGMCFMVSPFYDASWIFEILKQY